MKLDAKSLKQLKAEVAKIPQQRSPRAEAGRQRLQQFVARVESESKR